MATKQVKSEEVGVTRTLDWKGAAVNAMALIAPGAFLCDRFIKARKQSFLHGVYWRTASTPTRLKWP